MIDIGAYPTTKLAMKLDIHISDNAFHKETRCPSGVEFEQLSQHSSGTILPLGSYSYCYSELNPCGFIGRFCAIGPNVRVMQDQNPVDWVSASSAIYSESKFRFWTGRSRDAPVAKVETQPKPISIGHDVWVGQDVILKGGIEIGTGAVVGAGAVVTKDVEPYSIVAGSPAKVLRYRFSEETRRSIMKTEWWKYELNSLQILDFSRPDGFSTQFRVAKTQNRLVELPVTRRTLASHLLTIEGP